MKKSRVGPYNPEAATALAVVLHRHLTHPDTDRMVKGYFLNKRSLSGARVHKWALDKRKVAIDTELVRAFQGAADLVDDGTYGAATAGALSYWFGASGKTWVSHTESGWHGRWLASRPADPLTREIGEPPELLYRPPDDVRRLCNTETRMRYSRAGMTWKAKHTDHVAPKPVSYEREVSPYFDPGFEDWPGALAEFVTITRSCGCGRFNGECLCEISQIGSESFFHGADEDVDVVDVLDVFTDSK